MNLYVYRYARTEFPSWEPLEWAAARSASLPGSPPLDPDPFMYMGRLESTEGRPDLHLYKHYLTRRYLNVDDAHQVYCYVWSEGETGELPGEYDVYYRRLRGLARALDNLDLHLLEHMTPMRFEPACDDENNVVLLRPRTQTATLPPPPTPA